MEAQSRGLAVIKAQTSGCQVGKKGEIYSGLDGKQGYVEQ